MKKKVLDRTSAIKFAGVLQILLKMKLTLFVLAFSFFGAIATESYSQTKLSLNLKNTTVRGALDAIENQSEFFFLYSEKIIDVNRKVDVEVKQSTVDKILDLVFNGTDVSYTVKDRQIILTTPQVNSLLTSSEASQQKKSVSGKVTDSSGGSLPGVSVVVKGTTLGVITDNDGKFSISSVPENAILQFSFVGMKAQEIVIANKAIINVTLAEETVGLEEVVAVGYGKVKKSDLTGSISKVSEARIKEMPVVSLDRALSGKVTGVQVTQNSANPGGASTIRIRGAGSVNASNEPLVVIDGFPTGGLNSVNPDDIESMEVLKDASAVAIYGSRGSNGVVLVTTKHGKAGKTTVSLDNYYGIQSIRRKIPLLNARQFADFVNEARTNGGAKPYFDGSSADQPLPSNLITDTDWQDQVFSNAPIHNHLLSVSGGSNSSRYSVSFGYYGQDGIVKNSGFNRYSVRANLDNNLTSKLRLGVNFQGGYTESNNARTDVDGLGGGGVTSSALSYAPNFPVYDANGNYYKNFGSLNGYSVDNPLAIINGIINKSYLSRIFVNTFIEYQVLEGLNIRTSVGSDIQNTKSNYYATRNAVAGQAVLGTASISSSQSINWLNENTINYSRIFADKNSITALLGYTIQGIKYEGVSANASTFPNDFATYNNLGSGSTLVAPGSSASDWRIISYIGRLNYIYDDRFLLTLTARRDGSSRFGPNNKFGYFPSGSFGWKIKNEKWLKELKSVSDAKIRVSYGLSGNQEIGNFRYLANIATQTTVLGGSLLTGSYTGGISNPDLSWEKNAQFDVGVDIGLFNNRIQITSDYYIKKTSDLLFNVAVPSSSGFGSTLKNIGSVENKGFEFSLSSINYNSKDFRWNSEFNITTNQNKILKLDGRKEFTTGNDALLFGGSFNQILLREGSSLGNFYGRVMDGIFQTGDDIASSAQPAAKPGDIRYKDLNGDKVINDADRTIIGNSTPDFFGGLSNTFSYKGFELNVFMQGTFGNEILNFGTFDLVNLTGANNQSEKVLDRWTTTNPSNSIPRANSAAGSRILSSFQIEDGSFLRFSNISLGYNLPKAYLDKISLSTAKIYISALNWYTITKYSGYDPEVNRFGSSSLSQGIDYGAYPSAKSLILGINLKF